MEILLEENPILGYPLFNPRGYRTRGKSQKRRNPVAGKKILGVVPAEYTQRVDATQILAAVGGFWVSAWGSQQLVATTTTMTQKLTKLGAGVGLALVAGMAGKTMNKDAATAAVLGGLANVTIQGLEMFTDISIGKPSVKKLLPPGGGRPPASGVSRWPASTYQHEFDNVRLS